MTQLLNLIFLLVLATVLYLPFLGVWIGILYLLRVKQKRFACVLSFPIYLIVLLAWVNWQNRPEAVFEGSFGFPPPVDVRGLESDVWILGDSGRVFLRFNANPQTVQRIIARGLTPSQSNPSPSVGSPPPPWWKPSTAPAPRRYEGTFTRRSFAMEREILIYDPATGDVWFQFSGID